MQLIATRTQRLCNAAGTAIAFLSGEDLEYKVATGIASGLMGMKMLADVSSSFRQLDAGQVVESDTWHDVALGTRVNAKSVLTLPIHRSGALFGCIQLFSRIGQFSEESKRTCELMSAILNQVIGEGEPQAKPVDIEKIPDQRELEPDAQRRAEQQEQLSQSSAKEEAIANQMQSGQSTAKFVWPLNKNESKRETAPQREMETEDQIRNQGKKVQTEGLNRNNPIVSFEPPQLDRKFLASRPQSEKWNRAMSVIYPLLVVIFVAMVNIEAHAQGWALRVASVLIVTFTVVEVLSEWSEQDERSP